MFTANVVMVKFLILSEMFLVVYVRPPVSLVRLCFRPVVLVLKIRTFAPTRLSTRWDESKMLTI